MISLIILLAILGGAGWFIWRQRARQHTQAAPLSPQGIPPETLALEAFAHGNTCLAEGRFEEAITAFHRSRELDPKRPHVADRLAEVERRRRAATLPPPGV